MTKPNTQELFKLAETLHKQNVAKGFWDEKRNEGEILKLAICESSEAVEGDRKGKKVQLEAFEKAMLNDGNVILDFTTHFRDNFKKHIKDSIEDEICDTQYRLLDYLHYLITENRLVEYHFETHKEQYTSHEWSSNFAENMLWIDRAISDVYFKYSAKLYDAILLIDDFCEFMEIDLYKHIELKRQYNATRPPKHGKKY